MENKLLSLATAALRAMPAGNRSQTPQRILVIRLGNLGDIIVALPAFHTLRDQYPHAQITLLTSPTKRGAPGAREVLQDNPVFDDMIVYYEDESAKPAFLRELRAKIAARNIDLAVILPDDMTTLKSMGKYLFLLASAGIRNVTGAQLVGKEDWKDGQVRRIMEIVAPPGSPVLALPWITPNAASVEKAARLLAPAADGPIIGMQCGSKRLANRWMPERFIEVGEHLIRNHNAWVILTGSPGEKELTAAIQDAIGPRCLNLAGETTIPELAAVARHCTAFVSNDTGTMHVAAAMGVPVVAIFGARDYKYRWYPYGGQHHILRVDIECSPCFADTCPKYTEPECLKRIGVSQVTQALDQLLERGRG